MRADLHLFAEIHNFPEDELLLVADLVGSQCVRKTNYKPMNELTQRLQNKIENQNSRRNIIEKSQQQKTTFVMMLQNDAFLTILINTVKNNVFKLVDTKYF